MRRIPYKTLTVVVAAIVAFGTFAAIHTNDPPTVTATATPALVDAPPHDGTLEAVAEARTIDFIEAVAYRHAIDKAIFRDALATEAQAQIDAQAAREAAQAAATPPPAPTSTTSSSGSCGALPASVCEGESGFDPNAYNATGCSGRGCFGKYQFDPRTWAGAGCPGHPSGASESTQDACAAKVWDGGAGCSHWSAC